MLHDPTAFIHKQIIAHRGAAEIARARAQAALRNAMQSPDGIRFSPVPPPANPNHNVFRQQVRAETLRSMQIPNRIFSIIVLLAVAFAASSASAQCPRCGQFHPPYDRQPVRNVVGGVTRAAVGVVAGVLQGSADALDEVNAARAARGLRPFLRDPALTQAALSCAQIRAVNRIAGHLRGNRGDFAYVPPGAFARSAGCGAMSASWGWNTCCTYENYTYAGAAWVMGADGKRYMHLFVR